LRAFSIDRIVAYLPALAFVLLIPLANFFPNALNALGLQYLFALLGLAMVGIGVQIENRSNRASETMDRLRDSVQKLVDTQTEYLERTRRPVVPSSFAEGFKQQMSLGSRIAKLRVFAISSQQILSFMQFERMQVGECKLLLRAFDPKDQNHKEFSNQIALVVRDWNRLASDGKIGHLQIRSYDFLPTEYQVIFDDQTMLAGLYHSEPSDYSEVRVQPPFLVDGSTTDGKAVIDVYRDRFDRLFDKCATAHGPNVYESFNFPPEGKHV
jgi:hypothetical protein